MLVLLALSSLSFLFAYANAAIPSKTNNYCDVDPRFSVSDLQQCVYTEGELGLAAVDGRLTNGQRLARGLPPKPPVRRSSYKASRAIPSPKPLRKGYLKVYTGSTFLGYVQDTLPYGPGYYYGATSLTNTAGNLIVGYNTDDQANGLSLDLQTFNGPYATRAPYFGAVDTSAGNVLGPGSFNIVYATATNQTPRNSVAQNVGCAVDIVLSSSYKSESNIWFIDSATNIVTAFWTNPDGSGRVPLYIYQFVSLNIFILAGDQAAYANNPSDLLLTLVFEPIV